MGKNTVRLFCSLGIFIFSLCFTKVLNAPPSTQSNIIDVMQNDDKLCSMPKYAYENDIIKECRNVTYLKPELAPKSKMRDTVLCTVFYDTWYKYCTRDQSQVLFNNTASFLSYIQKFSPGKNDTAFCDNIKSIKFSYDKLKSSLSHANLNAPYVCYPICFEMNGNFVPLCGILAWSKSLDDEAEQVYKNSEPDKPKVSENTPAHQQAQESNAPADISSMEKAQGIDKDNTNENVKTNVEIIDTAVDNNEKSKAKPVTDVDKKMKSSIEKPESETVAKEKFAKDTDAAPSNQQVPNDDKETVEKLHKEETRTEAQNKGESTKSNVNTGTKGTENDDIEANKKEIISPNTDDHDNSNIQDDWNHLEDDKLPNDPNDDQPSLPDPAGDQSQGVPEPSEQRDIMSRYSIRTDEDSHFFTYFTIVPLVSIAAYIAYHNKQKILAIVLEGRRSRNSRGRRRPSTANYRKLDCTLEEAVTSQCDANVTHVIY